MLRLIVSLARHRRLLKDFVERDLKARYVGSSMGFFWSVVFPIINLFVYMFVFRIILNARWGDRQGSLEVALVMLAGIVAWAAFAETVSRSTNSLVENSNLIQKVVFPSELLPAYLTVSSLINMCIGLPVVLLCVGWFAYVGLPKAHVVLGEGPAALVTTEGRDTVAIPIALERGHHGDVSIPIEFHGEAVRGEDFFCDADVVVLRSGELRVDLLLVPLHDADASEGPETLRVVLGEPRGAHLVGPEGAQGMARWRDVVIEDGPAVDPAGLPAPVGPSVRHFERGPNDHPYFPLALGASLVSLPVILLLQALFTVGLGYFLAALNLFLRDTYHLVGVGVTVWMFSTPIFYPAELVERAGWGLVLRVNPMHWLIESYRAVLLYGRWPDPLLLLQVLGAGVLTLALGGGFFMAQKSKFPDLL